ncbi:Phenylalanine--tRNA ligase, mitochondrial [Meloidogyne graminicola]|nr:Phenylalanine--tRNA ligase, mitochondrial [Meloidogyne graminicola]
MQPKETLFVQNYENILGNMQSNRQACHTHPTVQALNVQVRVSLNKLLEKLCGKFAFNDRPAAVPFIFPSNVLKMQYKGQLIEIAHFGILDQKILFETKHKSKVAYIIIINLDNLTIMAKDLSNIKDLWPKNLF